MVSDPNKIIDKIRKLLALARSSNLHEAAAAAERAGRLMLEHRLSEADVAEPIITERLEIDERFMAAWRWGLLTACARSYYCECVRLEETTTLGTLRVSAIIFGMEEDIAAVVCLYGYLSSEIDALADRSRPVGQPPSLYAVDRELRWKEGAVRAITEKLEKGRIMFERETPEAERRATKAWKAVREYREKKYPERYRPAMNEKTDPRTFEEGFKAADKMLSLPDRTKGRLGDS